MPENIKKKIVLIGEVGVGKTQLLNVVTGLDFKEDSRGTVAAFIKKLPSLDNIFNFEIVDTTGSKKDRDLVGDYVRDANVVILCFSLVDKTSFAALEERQVYCNDKHSPHSNLKFVLVGTKSDLMASQPEKTVTKDEIDDFVKKNNMEAYYQTSAKNRENTENLITRINQDLEQKNHKAADTRESHTIIAISEPLCPKLVFAGATLLLSTIVGALVFGIVSLATMNPVAAVGAGLAAGLATAIGVSIIKSCFFGDKTSKKREMEEISDVDFDISDRSISNT